MAAIGSLIFCTDCGDLLPASNGSFKDVLHCECCGAENQDIAPNTTRTTKSNPDEFSSSFLRQKLSNVQTVNRHEVNTEATTAETCPKCGRPEVRFSAVQLRSADEGSTVFFTCNCGHKWCQNN